MKYIKTFEKIGHYDDDDRLNFIYEKGDLVKLLQSAIDTDDELSDFNSTDIYIIISVDKTDDYSYEIIYPFEYHTNTFVKEDQLTTPTKQEIEDFKIQQEAKKYNL